MDQPLNTLNPPDWQACVTTIKCDLINEYVSIMVKNDWSSKCTWYQSYKASNPDGKKKIKVDRITKKLIGLCQGPLCSHVISYRDKLINESKESSRGS